jgi:hypothetical protein
MTLMVCLNASFRYMSPWQQCCHSQLMVLAVANMPERFDFRSEQSGLASAVLYLSVNRRRRHTGIAGSALLVAKKKRSAFFAIWSLLVLQLGKWKLQSAAVKCAYAKQLRCVLVAMIFSNGPFHSHVKPFVPINRIINSSLCSFYDRHIKIYPSNLHRIRV